MDRCVSHPTRTLAPSWGGDHVSCYCPLLLVSHDRYRAVRTFDREMTRALTHKLTSLRGSLRSNCVLQCAGHRLVVFDATPGLFVEIGHGASAR